MTYPFLFLLLVGASYRVYRLVGRDDITESLRLRLPSGLRMPLACSWCWGFWSSLIVVATYWGLYGLPRPLLWVLAVSTAVGLIGVKLDG